MAIITLARQVAAKGDEVAQELAVKLIHNPQADRRTHSGTGVPGSKASKV